MGTPTSCLLVSPHFDDAILSCWSLVQRGIVTEVLTVFTGAPAIPVEVVWDRRCGFADSTAAMLARAAEDDAAWAGTTIAHRRCDLLEQGYRAGPPSAEDCERFEVEIAEFARRSGPDALVALPAAVGRPGSGQVLRRARSRLPHRRLGALRAMLPHADHVWVRDIGIGAAQRAGLPVLLYEDLPYGLGQASESQVQSLVRRLGVDSAPIRLPVDAAEKSRRVRMYHSQLEAMFPVWARRELEDVLAGPERMWQLVAGTDRRLSRLDFVT